MNNIYVLIFQVYTFQTLP